MTGQRLTNDSAPLVPRTTFDGPALELDFPGQQVAVGAAGVRVAPRRALRECRPPLVH